MTNKRRPRSKIGSKKPLSRSNKQVKTPEEQPSDAHVEENVFASRLSRPIRVIDDTVEQKPMIIMGRHNPNILTEYVVEMLRPELVPEDAVLADVKMDEGRKQELLATIDSVEDRFTAFIWDKVMPTLLGAQLSMTRVEEEVSELFGTKPNLLNFRSVIHTSVTASAVMFAVGELGLTEAQATQILQSKLDEQANRSRPDARPSRVQQPGTD